MSKQSEAKERQEYTPKLIPGICSNCEHMVCKRELPKWVQAINGDGRYTLAEYGVDKEFRCGIGGFSIKKQGSCAEHVFKPE